MNSLIRVCQYSQQVREQGVIPFPSTHPTNAFHTVNDAASKQSAESPSQDGAGIEDRDTFR